MKTQSGLSKKIQSDVIRALFMNQIDAIPTREEFFHRFAPQLLQAYQPNIPLGGIRIGKNGRCVDWGKKSIAKAQNTKRQNEADEIFNNCIAIIRSELERNQTTLPLQ